MVIRNMKCVAIITQVDGKGQGDIYEEQVIEIEIYRREEKRRDKVFGVEGEKWWKTTK